MDLEQLRAFVAVLEEGSLSGAARSLHRAQPGVTRLIQSLEAEVGVPLLDRSTKPARPTARGLALLEPARKALEAVAEVETLARPRRRAQVIPLRLGVSHALIRLLGHPEVHAWMKAHPRLELKVESGWSLDLVGQLRDRRIDAVLGPFSPAWNPPPSLRGRRFGQDDLVLVVPRGTTVPAKPSLRRLMDLPWVLNAEGCGVRAALERIFKEHGRTLGPAVEVTGDFGTLLDFVVLGYGVSLIPRWMVENHPLADRIQIHALGEDPMRTSVWLCWRDLPPGASGLLKGLEEALARSLSPILRDPGGP